MNFNFQRIYSAATEDQRVALDERAAILEYDAGYSRDAAEEIAAKEAIAAAEPQQGLFGEAIR